MEVATTLEQTCRVGFDVEIEEGIPEADYAVSQDNRSLVFRDQRTGVYKIMNTATQQEKEISPLRFAEFWVYFTGRMAPPIRTG
jgi:hypothetical protein